MTEPTLPIYQKDLDDHEKVEKFITIFGRQKYNKAIQSLSHQRFGNGAFEELQNEMINIDLNTPEGEQRYRDLRVRLEDIGNQLAKPGKAVYELPIHSGTADAIFQHRNISKGYLGTSRYLKGAFPEGISIVTDDTLRMANPGIREAEKKNNDRQQMIQQKEKELANLKR